MKNKTRLEKYRNWMIRKKINYGTSWERLEKLIKEEKAELSLAELAKSKGIILYTTFQIGNKRLLFDNDIELKEYLEGLK